MSSDRSPVPASGRRLRGLPRGRGPSGDGDAPLRALPGVADAPRAPPGVPPRGGGVDAAGDAGGGGVAAGAAAPPLPPGPTLRRLRISAIAASGSPAAGQERGKGVGVNCVSRGVAPAGPSNRVRAQQAPSMPQTRGRRAPGCMRSSSSGGSGAARASSSSSSLRAFTDAGRLRQRGEGGGGGSGGAPHRAQRSSSQAPHFAAPARRSPPKPPAAPRTPCPPTPACR
jgi:hypothetical protein